MQKKQLKAMLLDCNGNKHLVTIILLKGEAPDEAILRLGKTVMAVRDRIRVNSGLNKENLNEDQKGTQGKG